MLRLSKLFVKNWRTRVGNEPTVEAVENIIVDAVKIQQGKRFKNGGKTLSYYWHPELNLVLSIDHYNHTAVSVLSKEKRRKHCRQRGYITMTMHNGDSQCTA